MKPKFLAEELNAFAEKAQPQEGEALAQLYFHFYDMFQEYCGYVPMFEIVSNKGHVKLL